MFRKTLVHTIVLLMCTNLAYAQWLDISGLQVKKEQTELGGPMIVLEYDIDHPNLSDNHPAYVFIRYSRNNGASWQLLPFKYLRDDGFDIVASDGHKKATLWGASELGFNDLEQLKFKVHGIQMVKVPEGEFKMKSFPGGGKDPSISKQPNTNLSTYFIAKYEVTISMYVDYLNEIGGEGFGWNDRMKDTLRCGIIKEGLSPDLKYSARPGKENYPITYVSWYDAVAFLEWCGLVLPTEAMWEKAYTGGIHLDGDASKQVENPLPDRKYPWGDESPDEGGIYRCNFDGIEDGYFKTAPVGSYDEFCSPYGVCDMAGNMAEWTRDWYTTTYHAGLDGFRMVRGGSWMAVPFACDAVSGATQFPIKESSIMGFRGVR